MKKQSFRCDVYEAWNFTVNSQKLIGHITKLKIGGTEVKKCIEIADPTKATNTKKGITSVKVVAIISAIRWDGGYTDPITFTCQITADNYKKIAPILFKKDIKTNVDFGFCVYDYDHDNATPGYFKRFFTETDLKGLIEKNNGELEFGIEDQVSTIVPSPRNWELYLSIMPVDDKTMTVTAAPAKGANMVGGWGIKSKA